MARLIDTNVLVYSVDARFPERQETAANLLEQTVQSGECRIPHQTLLEFYAVVTRQLPGLKESLLTSGEAREEIEVLLLDLNRSVPGRERRSPGSVCYGDLRAKLV